MSDSGRSGLEHIAGPLAEILDEVEKRTEHPSGLDQNPVRRMRRRDLDAREIYLELTELSDSAALKIEELSRRKATIDSVRSAIALGDSTDEMAP